MRDCLRHVLPGLAAAWLSLPATAQQTGIEDPPADARRYAVEIILFRYADGVPAGNEVFPPEPPAQPPFGLPGDDADGARVFSDRPLPPDETASASPGDRATDAPQQTAVQPHRVRLTVTPREQLVLQDAYQKLERLDAYQPVLWAGWSQHALGEAETPRIELGRLGNAPPEFDGTLQLYMGRFLHLVVDVTLTPGGQRMAADDRPVAGFGDARTTTGRGDRRLGARDPVSYDRQTGIVRMRIDEDRIVKNGDLRYFDHPRFGLLAKVTRIEEPEDEQETDADKLPAAQ